jgi:hypothetical protein
MAHTRNKFHRRELKTRSYHFSLVLLNELVVQAHVHEDLDSGLAHGITAVLVAGELLLLENERLDKKERRVNKRKKTDALLRSRSADLDSGLGQVVGHRGTRRTGTNDRYIVELLRLVVLYQFHALISGLLRIPERYARDPAIPCRCTCPWGRHAGRASTRTGSWR